MAMKPVVGIDIGSHSVKLVQLRRVGKGWQLINYGVAPLPTETIVDGALMNSGAIVDAIMQLVATNKVRHKDVGVSVSGHSVIIKKISLAKMTKEELDETIHWEAEQFIPFDINDVNLDVQIVREDFPSPNQMEVVLVAAKKDMINDYTAVISEAGLTPVLCDVDVFAIQNMFESNYEVRPDETYALINAGAAVTNIAIVSAGVPTFTRDINIGGNQFTEELQKQLNVSYDEAEALKVGGAAGKESDAVVPQDVEKVLTLVAENVTGEIQRSLDFFTATSTDSPISRIYFVGGSSKLPSLRKSIEQRTGLKVEVVDPFRNINIDYKGIDHEFVRATAHLAGVAVGLAMREPGDK
jgi:type IV pilus assembly protein PilM